MTNDPKDASKRSKAKSAGNKKGKSNSRAVPSKKNLESKAAPVKTSSTKMSSAKPSAKPTSRQKAGLNAAVAAAKVGKTKRPAAEKAPRPIREKRVRDDFKMPENDYALIEALKQRALEFNRPTKKNELLRAGLQALGALDNAELQHRLELLSQVNSKRIAKSI